MHSVIVGLLFLWIGPFKFCVRVAEYPRGLKDRFWSRDLNLGNLNLSPLDQANLITLENTTDHHCTHRDLSRREFPGEHHMLGVFCDTIQKAVSIEIPVGNDRLSPHDGGPLRGRLRIHNAATIIVDRA